jgi:siroheme synthase-like protein
MKVYPVFLVGLDRRRTVVVGGAAEAERKIEGLLECDAAVVVIAPEVTRPIRAWVEEGRLAWIPRGYRPGDLHEAWLVIATGQDAATRHAIWQEADERATLINVVDDVDHCSFVAGSVVRRGPLAVAISTSGAAPALAVRLREQLERELGPEYAEFLEMLGALREPLARQVRDFSARRELWYRLVDSDILDELRAGRKEQARSRLADLLAEVSSAAEPPPADARVATPPREASPARHVLPTSPRRASRVASRPTGSPGRRTDSARRRPGPGLASVRAHSRTSSRD